MVWTSAKTLESNASVITVFQEHFRDVVLPCYIKEEISCWKKLCTQNQNVSELLAFAVGRMACNGGCLTRFPLDVNPLTCVVPVPW